MSVVDCLQHISSYFNKGPIKIDPKNPCLKSDGKKIHGFSTIVKYLCSKSTKCDLLGKTAEDQAVVGQWLEYVATVFQRSPKSDMEETFDNINTFLTDRVYLAGFHLTIADIVLYVALYKIIDNLTFQEKQHYMHISRWFNQVQQDPEVRQKNSEVTFMKNSIYSKWTH